MALGTLIKAFRTPQDKGITNELDKYILGKKSSKDLGRPYEERAIGVHHPSALSSVACIRELVYSWINAPISNQQHSVVSDAIFGAGHDFGYRMQSYFWDMGILLGEWHCIECKHTWLDMQNPSPRKCPNCGANLELLYNLHYLEVPLFDKEHNIMGRADGALVRDWGFQLIELKTIKNRDVRTREGMVTFDDLVAPYLSHQYQLNIYMDIFTKNYELCKSGSVIYGAKNTNKRKEFTLAPIAERVQEMHAKAATIDYHVNNQLLPPRPCEEKGGCNPWCKWKSLCWTEHEFKDVDRRNIA